MKLAFFTSASRLSNARRSTAILLTVVFGWMMIQPSLALRAQGTSNNPDGATTAKSRKKKKSKRSDSKAEDKRIILPPQIFATGAPPQQSVTANTQTTVVRQKAKPLVKPTSIKPTTKVVGKTYQAMSRQIESAGQ